MEIKIAEQMMIGIDKYPHVHDSQTLKEAILVFLEAETMEVRGKHSLPRVLLVFDAVNVVVGMLRRRDILRGLEPDFLVKKPLAHREELVKMHFDPNLTEFSFEKIVEGLKDQAAKKVYEVMVPIKSYVHYNDHIGKIIYSMVSNNVSLLPVVKGSTVVGVLRSVDVFYEVEHIVLEDEQDE